MDSDSVRGIGRRRLLGWGGLAADVRLQLRQHGIKRVGERAELIAAPR